MGKGLDVGSIEKRDIHLANRCPLSNRMEENSDRRLLCCVKVQNL